MVWGFMVFPEFCFIGSLDWRVEKGIEGTESMLSTQLCAAGVVRCSVRFGLLHLLDDSSPSPSPGSLAAGFGFFYGSEELHKRKKGK